MDRWVASGQKPPEHSSSSNVIFTEAPPCAGLVLNGGVPHPGQGACDHREPREMGVQEGEREHRGGLHACPAPGLTCVGCPRGGVSTLSEEGEGSTGLPQCLAGSASPLLGSGVRVSEPSAGSQGSGVRVSQPSARGQGSGPETEPWSISPEVPVPGGPCGREGVWMAVRGNTGGREGGVQGGGENRAACWEIPLITSSIAINYIKINRQ